MRIGIDDTDSPEGMCTTYLGAVLLRRLQNAGMTVGEARLIRLNPNVIYKTRGNAAICLDVSGDQEDAFRIACQTVDELADLPCENTNPGVVVTSGTPPGEFYRQAVTGFCELKDAISILEETGAYFKGYKNQRGLIGATAAVCSELPDRTFELLAYRTPARWGTPRDVDGGSLFLAEEATFPDTWDSVDRDNRCVVCVPHTPDPVLFGIRGASPQSVSLARSFVRSELPAIEQIFLTNQGTDAHLLDGAIGQLLEGCSYRIPGMVSSKPETGPGGHVSVTLAGYDGEPGGLRCMAYEPTKGFRHVIRQLLPGDRLVAVGSYKAGSLNLEKILIIDLSAASVRRPPQCPVCDRRMTSAGSGKGYKCRVCSGRSGEPVEEPLERRLSCGWYEVPPSARRHLARPLCRGTAVHHEERELHADLLR